MVENIKDRYAEKHPQERNQLIPIILFFHLSVHVITTSFVNSPYYFRIIALVAVYAKATKRSNCASALILFRNLNIQNIFNKKSKIKDPYKKINHSHPLKV